MSIFGKSKGNSTSVTAPVYEGYGAEINGDILAIQESWEDHQTVIEALHALDIAELTLRNDVKSLQESGAEASEIEAREAEYATVTEAMVKNAWEGIKNFFNKLWGKIKAFFKSIVAVFDGIFKNAQDFVKKYDAELRKRNLTGFEYKMHSYTNIDKAAFMELDVKAETQKILVDALKVATTANTDKEIETLGNEISKLKENKEDILDSYRGEVIGTASVNSNQFEQVLYSIFRNGAKDKGDAKEQAVKITEIIDALKNTDGKTKAEAFAKKTDEEFAKIIKTVADMENALGKSDKHHDNYTPARNAKVVEALRTFSTLFSAQKDIQLGVFRAWKTAFAERNSVYKAVCGAALRYKAK